MFLWLKNVVEKIQLNKKKQLENCDLLFNLIILTSMAVIYTN